MLPVNPLLSATAPAGPHLPVALLRQYAAGTLAPAAQHRVEAHTLACPRCADVLAGLLQTPPATTDQALAQLQQRLRKRVQQAAPARPALGARQHRWLAPQLAAAAALLLGLVAGGWWAWQQRHPAAAGAGPAAVAVVTLPPPPSVAPAPGTKPAPAAPLASSGAATPQRPARAAARVARRWAPRPSRPTVAPAADAAAQAVVVAAAPEAAPPEAAPSELPVAVPSATAPSVAAKAASATLDTVAFAGRAKKMAMARPAPSPEAARGRAAMPAAPALAPAPVGGYAALREKLRRGAAEFVPEAPDQPLSGTVQLRLTIGADGKIQQINVLRGLRADYDAEAQRLVCQGPAWVPGISAGRRAALMVDVAVPF